MRKREKKQARQGKAVLGQSALHLNPNKLKNKEALMSKQKYINE